MGENLSLVLGGGAMNKLNWINILPGSALQLQPTPTGIMRRAGGVEKVGGGMVSSPLLVVSSRP